MSVNIQGGFGGFEETDSIGTLIIPLRGGAYGQQRCKQQNASRAMHRAVDVCECA